MNGLLIAIFLGWAGGYRFYRKQVKLGFIYLFTGGLFLIGWLIDILMALKEIKKISQPFTMTIEIRGAFAECKKNASVKRWAVVNGLQVGTALGVEIAYFEGKPYYQLLAPDGLDVGAFPSEVSQQILSNYRNPKITAELIDKADPEHPYARISVKP